MRNIHEAVTYRPDLGNCTVPVGLRSTGHAKFAPGQSVPARRINFIQLIWTVRGQGYAQVGNKARVLRENWALFCFPDSIHQLSTRKNGWEYRWCTFDGDSLLSAARDFRLGRMPFYAGPCRVEAFERLKRMLRDTSPAGEIKASCTAYGFLGQMAEKLHSYGNVRKLPEPFKILLDEIAVSLGEPGLCVEWLAQKSGISRFSIHRIFNKELGISPKRYIDTLRQHKALSLLKDSGMRIEDIARATGFTDANYFAKFIRRKTSHSPSQFRRTGLIP